MDKELLIQVKGLTKHFPIQRGFWSRTTGYVKALNNVSLEIQKGKIIGIVGESGCGKSTLGKLMLRLIEPTCGEVLYKGENVFSMSSHRVRALRQKLQIIFQNPYSSLNPRMKIYDIVCEPILVHKVLKDKNQIKDRVNELLSLVGLESLLGNKYPHELSGGQRQRVAIARALSLNPEFLVLDEPISALDVSIQAQILNLLLDLQKKLNLTYLFISHNLQAISYIATQIAVMYLGHIVEISSKENIIKSPKHPYTIGLLSSAPTIDFEGWQKTDSKNGKKKTILSGDIPDPSNPPSGCVFRTRCPIVKEKCTNDIPLLIHHDEQLVACHYAGELSFK
ncbi:MAG: ATP-binding cassette domain-containing protein [Candidatus Melainabacteria bacterium]|nr:ATP-binding cassette domain-containing protein [Candidatus Melainabacteria bacterium]